MFPRVTSWSRGGNTGSRRSPEDLSKVQDERGVTLVEILMVVIVVVIVGGLAMPWFLGVMESYRGRVAAWELAGDLRLARQKAVSTQVRHRICFSNCGSPVPAGGYLLEREDATGWVVDMARTDLPDGVSLASNVSRLTFGATGDGSGGTTTLTNDVGTYEVVTAPSGRVRVCKGTCS